MPTIEHIFAKDLQVGDVLADPPPEVYTGSPDGPFVEHTKVCRIDHEYLRGLDLGAVRDLTPSDTKPEELLYLIHPDANQFDTESLTQAQAFIDKIEHWVPAAPPEHEMPQVEVITRRFGPRWDPKVPTERLLLDDGSHAGSEQIFKLRWGALVPVIRGDLSELHSKPEGS